MSHLRILHVISSMSPEAGGPPAVCAGMTGDLAARGHQLTIATVDDQGGRLIPVRSGVQIQLFPLQGSARFSKSPALDSWLRTNVSKFDIVHLHSIWQFPTFAAARACWRARKPYVSVLHGMLDVYSLKNRSYRAKQLYWHWREKSVQSRSAGVQFLNAAEIRRAVSWVRPLHKFILPNGLLLSELNNLPSRGLFRGAHPEFQNRPIILFLSRLHPKKGLDRFIPAWPEVVRQVPDALLVIAGAGDDEYTRQIDSLIAQHNVQSSVIRVGQLDSTHKWQALVDADLFVLPSHQEGFSMAITEALGAGCTPVVTEDCNYDELAQSDSGIIIPGGDMRAFAQSIVDLLGDAPRSQRLAANGRKLVAENYTWEKIGENLEQIYRFILAGNRLPADGSSIWRDPTPA